MNVLEGINTEIEGKKRQRAKEGGRKSGKTTGRAPLLWEYSYFTIRKFQNHKHENIPKAFRKTRNLKTQEQGNQSYKSTGFRMLLQ